LPPRALAAAVHRRFRQRPGSKHIATESAIAGLVAALYRRRPARVLELGAGIGTLTAAAIDALRAVRGDGGFELVTVEDDPFCIAQLACNLADRAAAYELVTRLDDLDEARRFDFLIVDGGDPADPRPFHRLAPRATVFIEGDRKPQAALCEAALAGRRWIGVEARTLRRRRLAEGRRVFDGGYRLYQLAPSFGERLRFALLRLRTALVWRLRRLA